MSNLFRAPAPPPALMMAPTPTPTATMPDPGSPSVIEARRRQQASMMNRGGRRSTILNPGGTQGAPGSDRFASYSSSRLGADA